MEAHQRTLFLHARRFERDLNERQRAILARLARGETNAQIADAYGMTFDGAKWNVSEILSKLGLSSREEAADYWRWRQSARTRLSEVVRALVPASLPGKVLLAGGLATLIAVVAVAGLFATDGDRSGARVELSPTPPFRLVAELTGTLADGEKVRSMAEWAWQDATHFRHSTVPLGSAQTRVDRTGDGTYLWTDVSNTDEVVRTTLQPGVADSPFLPWGQNIGPIPGDNLDDVLELLRTRPAGLLSGKGFAHVIGRDTLLGREVIAIEYGPIWADDGTTSMGAPDPSGRTYSGGTGYIWLDPSTSLVMQVDEYPAFLRDGKQVPGYELFITVTSFWPNDPFAPNEFVFVLPPGKTERAQQ